MTARKNKAEDSASGIILYAKPPGITSFSSLWSIKNALNTGKVGHTGTLDSFAEGLLVALSGRLTHLVPHITSFAKTYQAVVCFGIETDTLDPTGAVVRTGNPVSREAVEGALKQFTGAVLQVPPVYSAVHVGGRRASDIARSGEQVRLESRQVFIYRNELADFKEPDEDGCSYALLEITCSKGTYIRSLARDIAASLGTCAHLCALRRTQVGSFRLEDSACFSSLKTFTIEAGIQGGRRLQKEHHGFRSPEKKADRNGSEPWQDAAVIRSRFQLFTPQIACQCGFGCGILRSECEKMYLNGRPLSQSMLEMRSGGTIEKEIAVFYRSGDFAGIVRGNGDGRLSYGFVVPPEKRGFRVFSWDEFCGTSFPVEWKARGCALTAGSFDAVHAGHSALIRAAVEKTEYVPGVITFSSSIKSGGSSAVFTVRQRLKFFRELGAAFAVVIDFTPEFSRISGHDFIDSLISSCGMKFLAEGKDFRCGRGGSVGMEELCRTAGEKQFEALCLDDVVFDGVKISSSRIKAEIREGRFGAVEKMLLRPFAYDVQGFSWKEVRAESGSSVFEAPAATHQILPKDGAYKAVAVLSGGTALHTDVRIERESVRLSLPSLNIAEQTEEIQFCP